MSVTLDQPVADFQAQATSGQQIRLADLQGRNLVLY
ncbi:MAG: peroxiredoxin, partial [Pseudomonadota bacterium]|nr:peroxiredoxin [Pseudomonadota bacterium]